MGTSSSTTIYRKDGRFGTAFLCMTFLTLLPLAWEVCKRSTYKKGDMSLAQAVAHSYFRKISQALWKLLAKTHEYTPLQDFLNITDSGSRGLRKIYLQERRHVTCAGGRP